ncbi:hypothetical protein STEG23_027852 [Scotinomys teguina]
MTAPPGEARCENTVGKQLEPEPRNPVPPSDAQILPRVFFLGLPFSTRAPMRFPPALFDAPSPSFPFVPSVIKSLRSFWPRNERVDQQGAKPGLHIPTHKDYLPNGPLQHLVKSPELEVFLPYTPMKGEPSNVWFDRFKISNDCPEHLESVDGMCQVLTELIDAEVKNGIQKSRILIGGFSMGGCMAIHLAYRKHQDVAGVFALSSFLNKESTVYKDLQRSDCQLPELFQCHGTADELVLHSWGKETNSRLKSLGVSTVFHSLPNLYHEINRTELEMLKSWILTKLPGEIDGQNK